MKQLTETQQAGEQVPAPTIGISRRTAILLRSLVLAVAVLVSLLSAEGILRILRVPPVKASPGDAVLGYSYPAYGTDTFDFPEYGGPLTLRSNNLSFREDHDTSVVKAPGTQRIVVVGDSQTAGQCANSETYPHNLDVALRRSEPSAAYEVINAGTGRYSPYQYLVKTERDIAPLNPDRLIVGLYMGNDLMDLMRRDDRPYLTAQPDGSLAHHPPDFVKYDPPGYRPEGLESSRVYAVGRRALGPTVLYQLQRARMLLHDAQDHNIFSVAAYMWDVKKVTDISLGFSTQSLLQYVWFHHFPGTLPVALGMNKEILRRFKEFCDQRHIALTYAIIPSKVQIEPKDFSNVLEHVRKHDATMTLEALQTFEGRLTDHVLNDCDEAGVPAIDLRPALKHAASGQRLYYQDEMHLTPAGNRVVGEAIAAALRQAPGRLLTSRADPR